MSRDNRYSSVRLPQNLLDKTYGAPPIILCETDKTPIARLDVLNLSGTFKFNSYSEISFEFPRYYTDTAYGETEVNPAYDKVEALRLLYLGDDFGYFEIQEPSITGDGMKETKKVTAYSLEYTLSQRYLREFVIRMSYEWSIEDVVFCDENDHDHSLLHLALRKAYGWSVGHVDEVLKDKYASFEIDKISIYDFFITELSDKFHCIFIFDTINNTVNAYAESMSEIRHGDGRRTSFTLTVPYVEIGYITITDNQGMTGSFRTGDYTYDPVTGTVTFNHAPAAGTTIEIVDGYQSAWDTDVYVSFENLSKEMTIDYSADNIKTVIYGKGRSETQGLESLEFREVNMGLPYVVDLSYYHTVDWMGQELYDMYKDYTTEVEDARADGADMQRQLVEIINAKNELETRVSTKYILAQHVTSSTVGTYYVRSGSYPNYLYTEVTLPQDYQPNVKYYSLLGVNLTAEKISHFQEALAQELFRIGGEDVPPPTEEEDTDPITFDSDIIKEEFEFVEPYTILDYINDISAIVTDTAHIEENYTQLAEYTNTFWEQAWEEYGIRELKAVEDSKNTVHTLEDEDVNPAAEPISSFTYCAYRANYIMLNSVRAAKAFRQQQYDNFVVQQKAIEASISSVGANLDLEYYFKQHTFIDPQTGDETSGEALLPRLSAFLREDEYINDAIVVTDAHTDSDIYKLQEELRQDTIVELSHLCKPQLAFSMDMANLYALPEFAPLVQDFQLGNLIRVALRPDYLKRARLLQVDLDFNDLTRLSCTFGDLTSAKSASDIHADLLAQAIQAGKTVSSNKSYWNQGSTKANSIDSNIQSGLLDSIESIKSLDGTQGVEIDKYGIHLRQQNGTDYDPKQVWMVNNKIIFTDDNFKTAKTVLGEFKYGDRELYGVLAEGVVGGLVAGSEIEGGTIKIGDRGDGTYNFEVDENGVVTIRGGSGLAGDLEEIEAATDRALTTIASDPAIIAFRCNSKGEFLDTSTSLSVYFNVAKDGVEQDYVIKTFETAAGYTIQNGVDHLEITPTGVNAADNTTIQVVVTVNDVDYDTSISLIKQYDGADAMNLSIYSTNGLVFKAGEYETYVYAVVRRGTTDVTLEIPYVNFHWKKIDKDGIEAQDWTPDYVYEGRHDTIRITNEDIFERATFECSIDDY